MSDSITSDRDRDIVTVRAPRRRGSRLARLLFVLGLLVLLLYPAERLLWPRAIAVTGLNRALIVHNGGLAWMRFAADPADANELAARIRAGRASLAGAAWIPARAADVAAGVTSTFVPLWLPAAVALLLAALTRTKKTTEALRHREVNKVTK